MSRPAVIWSAVICAVLVAAGYGVFRIGWGIHDWRERMTVTLETPEGPVTRDSLRAIRFVQNARFSPVRVPLGFQVRGEAVMFDLGANGALFVLVGADAPNLYRELLRDDATRNAIRRNLWQPGLSRELATDNYPTLAYFPDPSDPLSAKLITRLSLPNLVPGYKITGITLSRGFGPITRGPVTDTLPWLLDETLYQDPRWREMRQQNGFLRHAINGLSLSEPEN